jgi:nickel-dependent lactate racemase
MDVTIPYGHRRAELQIADAAFIPSRTAAPHRALADPAGALRTVLETPLDFPALRRALTPDDHLAVLVDEHLPRLTELLVPLLECLVSAGVAPDAITLLCAPPSTGQPWLEGLPEALEEVRCEVHDPVDRRRLAFVTTTAAGRPLLFNRTAVDAAQLIILSRCRFDALLGHGGGAGWMHTTFSDQASRAESSQRLSVDAPGETPWPIQTEATEAAWLLGAPFFVQVIEGRGDDIADVLAGPAPSLVEGWRRLEAQWRCSLPRQPDTVLAAVSGDPARHDLDDLADALTAAARVVRPGGRIILLSETTALSGPALSLLSEADEPADVLREYARRKDLELRGAWQWASAAQQASLYSLTREPADVVENLFVTPLEGVEQVQRLVSMSEACVVLEDAHKTLAVVEAGE